MLLGSSTTRNEQVGEYYSNFIAVPNDDSAGPAGE